MKSNEENSNINSPRQGKAFSRRDFLGMAAGGAFALAGTSLFGQSAARVESGSSQKKLRIGVAGGRFGATFHFHLHPDCVVTGVTDLRSDRRARLQKVYGCETSYDSLETMVKEAKDIDAVAIFTDGPLHAMHTKLCMERGWHVICAVPACFTLAEAAMLKEVKERTGMTYMMAETSYYKPMVISARQFLRRGPLAIFFPLRLNITIRALRSFLSMPTAKKPGAGASRR